MTKRERSDVQHVASLGEDTSLWALWRLSVILRDIAAADDQAEKPKNIEKNEPPSQAPAEDAPTGCAKESSSQ